jgi:hypothetical protein
MIKYFTHVGPTCANLEVGFQSRNQETDKFIL